MVKVLLSLAQTEGGWALTSSFHCARGSMPPQQNPPPPHPTPPKATAQVNG